jgi:hypothetical protein
MARPSTQPDGTPWNHEGKEPTHLIVENGGPARAPEQRPVPRQHDEPAAAVKRSAHQIDYR